MWVRISAWSGNDGNVKGNWKFVLVSSFLSDHSELFAIEFRLKDPPCNKAKISDFYLCFLYKWKQQKFRWKLYRFLIWSLWDYICTATLQSLLSSAIQLVPSFRVRSLCYFAFGATRQLHNVTCWRGRWSTRVEIATWNIVDPTWKNLCWKNYKMSNVLGIMDGFLQFFFYLLEWNKLFPHKRNLTVFAKIYFWV